MVVHDSGVGDVPIAGDFRDIPFLVTRKTVAHGILGPH